VDTSGLRQWKLVAEIHYPGSASIFDKRGQLVQSFGRGRSLKWRIADNRVQLYDEKRQLTAFGSHDSAGISVEAPATADFFNESAQQWFGVLLPELGVSRLNRISVRSLLLLPQPDFADLTGKLRTVLDRDGASLWTAFGLEPVDLGFAFLFEQGRAKISLELGPMKKAEVEGDFESDSVVQKLPEILVFADFRYFESNPEFDRKSLVTDMSRFIKAGCDQAYERTSALLASIGGGHDRLEGKA